MDDAPSPSFFRLFFPRDETWNETYLAELSRQVQLGLKAVGAILVLFSLAIMISLGIAWQSGLTAIPPEFLPLTLGNNIFYIALGVAASMLARRPMTPNHGRLVIAVVTLCLGASIAYSEMVMHPEGSLSGTTWILFLVAAAAPFRPMQVLALGTVLTVVFVNVTLFFPEPAGLTQQMRVDRIGMCTVPIVVVTFACTVMTAILYANRVRMALAQVEAEELRQKLRRIVEAVEISPVPIVRFSKEGTLLWQNPAAEHYARKIGEPEMSILDFLPQDFLERVPEVLDPDGTQMVESHSAFDRYFATAYNLSPVDGEFIVTMQDVTAENRARQKVENYASDLEQTQVRLVQSEKMAALGNLVAGIAHEINTPMGAIHANADVHRRAIQRIREAWDDEKLQELLQEHEQATKALGILEKTSEVTNEATHRIVRIIRSLKSFARLDASERDTVDVHEGIESTLTLLQHELKDRVEVKKEFGELPQIRCYPNQLNQVFMNLLANAAQSIPEKGTITLRSRAENEDWAVFEVSDTGGGIKPENIDRIFDPGFTTKGVGVGTGLGLSITYQIIDEHQGTIEVESEVGKGTTMRIRLPLREPVEEEEDNTDLMVENLTQI